jgi:hypothetical protein
MKLIGFTRKTTWLPTEEHGWGCGYVAVPKEHKLYGVSYNQLDSIAIHRGLTFSDKWMNGMPEEVKEMWIFGFDCNHYGDTLENCPEEFVNSEVESLKEQLSLLS